MVKCNPWNPLPADFKWPVPPVVYPDPIFTPRTDAPGTPFPFLLLPRELRDQIYIHTFTTKCLRYRLRNHAATQWNHQTWKPPFYLSLLLTSRQFQLEAQAILFRTCTIEIESRHSHRTRYHQNSLTLGHTLRSFPSTPADLLTKIYIQYHNYLTLYRDENGEVDGLFIVWEHVVRDSYILKGHFPRLRTFNASFWAFQDGLRYRFFESVYDVDETNTTARQLKVQEKAQVIVQWLERCLQDKGLVPPDWLRIELSTGYKPSDEHIRCIRFQQEALDLAHRLYAKKRTVTQDELDESGKKWLEEWSAERSGRGRKGTRRWLKYK